MSRTNRSARAVLVAILVAASVIAPLQIFADESGGAAPSDAPTSQPSAAPGTELPAPAPSPAPGGEAESPGPAPPTGEPPAPTDQPAQSPAAEPAGESPSPMPPAPAPADASVPYVVTFADAASHAARSTTYADLGLAESASIDQLLISFVDVPAGPAGELIAALRGRAGVSRVEPDRERSAEAEPDDPRYAEQWALPAIGWQTVWNDRPAGEAVVALLDTGVDAAHPELAGAIVAGASFVEGTAAGVDPNGHGTWLAGLIAAAADNGQGISGAGGGVLRLMPITVLGADGTGRDSDIIAGLVHAVDNGADVALMAFSSRGYSVALQSAIDYAWDNDVVIVAAAGNESDNAPTYPAGDAAVVGVAATQADGTVWPGSNSGAAVFIAAPGAGVLTTALGGEYRTVTGTSAAAAYVAAAAGLLRAQDESLANGAIVGRLARTAAPAGMRETAGNGRLDLARAWSDRETTPLRPAGARDADGGPYVGPYEDGLPPQEPVYTAAASPSFRSATSNGIPSGSTSLAISKPSGTVTGDVMVALVAVRPSSATITAPSGWSLIRRTDQATGSTSSQAAYYKVATSSEPASYTWTIGASPTGAAGGIATFYNASTCSPIDVSNGQATASALTHAAPSVTTTQSGDMLVTGHSIGSAATWSAPSGMSEAFDDSSVAVPNTVGVSIEGSYQLLGAAGATGTRTATASNDADVGVGIAVALRSTCTRTWDGGAATSNWGDANNWNPNGVPTASDDVSLTGANTINVNVAASTADLTLNNSGLTLTISSGQSLAVSGNLTFTSGTLNTQAAFPSVTGTASLAAASTVGYTGSGNQTIAALAYGNLNSSSGTNTLAGNVTVAGNLSVSGGTLDLATFSANRTGAGGTLTVSNGATLKIGGTGTLPASYSTHSIGATSTVEYAGTSTSVAALNSSQTYGNLVISGTATTTSSSFAVAGTMTVNGTFTPAAASVISGAGTLTGSGTIKATRTAATADFASQYTIANKTLSGLTVEYAGSAAQVVSGLTYGGLRINNASGVSLAATTTVNGTLTFQSGRVTTGVSTLVVGASGSVSHTSGHVVGNLQRAVPTGAPTLTFDVGDATSYTPLSVSFASVTSGGTLTATTAAGDHAQIASSGLNSAKTVNRTWTLTGSGVVFTTYSATLTFVAGDLDAGASTGSFNVARYSAGSWAAAGTGTRTSTTTQGTAIAGFGDLAVGQPDLGIFSTSTDIGGPSLAGSASHSSGTYTLTGSGADIWDVADQFHYVYVPKSGDVRITARVVSLSNTDGWAKAGVMVRETTAAGSAHAFAAMTPANGMAFQWRASTNVASSNSNQTGLAAPYWVRVTRTGNSFVVERSPDGVSWTQQGATTSIVMAATVEVGLAVSSHNNSALATAVFDNVTVSSAPTAAADSYNAQPSTALNVNAAQGVLANDTDPENDALAASLVSTTANGALSLNADGSFTYTPTSGWLGTDNFTYRASDGATYSATQTVTINVIASVGFQAEDYVSGSATGAGFTTTTEGSALNGQAITTNGGNTNAAGPPVERVEYDVYFPNAGATNVYRLYMRYRLSVDSTNNDSGWAMHPLDQNATSGTPWDQVNDLYLHGDTSYRWVDLGSNPSGINGVTTYSNISAGAHTWWFGGREAGVYADAFVFSTGASLEGTSSGQAYLDSVVNDRPTAVTDSYSLNEDASLNVAAGSGVLANDTDPESNNLTAVLVSNVSNGTLALNANGSFTYTPSANFNGTDSFSYRARDSMVSSASAATVTITVGAVNDVPSFTKGANQSVNEDAAAQTVAGWASAISAGPSNESSQVVDFIVSSNNTSLFAVQPAVSAAGTLTYTPAPNAAGSATVSVQIHDNGGTANGGVDTSAVQTFTITVNAVNDGPVNTVPGGQSMAVNATLVFSSGSGNAVSVADIDAGSSSVRVTLSASNGTASLSGTTGLTFTAGDGTADATMTFSGTLSAINSALNGLSFTPTAQFAGSASLQVVTNDQGATGSGGALSDTDSVAISVTNTAPSAAADGYSVYQDNSLVVAAPGVLANDTDPDVGQTLTVQAPRPVSGPANGSLTLNADGSFSYTPASGFRGTDSFTYKATDGLGDSSTVTVTITVNSTAYVSASAWSSSFSASRYLDISYPAYLPVGGTVESATFHHSYRSYAGGTSCWYIEVWASGVLIGSHGSAAAPASCNSGTGFLTDDVLLPEVNSVARANALTIRLFLRNSAGGKSEHRSATLGVDYWLGNT